MKIIEITKYESLLKKKIASDPQRNKKIINDHNWKVKGLKEYLLSLAN
ncbi:hypothetical protein [Ligilactobacillus cholophilus]|nr:hypothetical protein [Ligilactobacillus cholophilus]